MSSPKLFIIAPTVFKTVPDAGRVTNPFSAHDRSRTCTLKAAVFETAVATVTPHGQSSSKFCSGLGGSRTHKTLDSQSSRFAVVLRTKPSLLVSFDTITMSTHFTFFPVAHKIAVAATTPVESSLEQSFLLAICLSFVFVFFVLVH